MSRAGDDEVLPFSRWHARLARARRLVDVDELVAHPAASALVPAMPPQDVFYLVKRIGLPDALDLLELCHPRQLQVFLDLDGWHKDRPDFRKLEPWLEALLATSPENVARALEGLDPEVWVLFLLRHVRVHEHSPELLDAFGADQLVVESPDRLYVVEILEPKTRHGELALRFVQHLFQHEAPLVWRRFFEAARWEIPAEVEEAAYRFRRGRLEDLGFVDYYEAMELFAWRDPHAAKRAGPRTTLPPPGPIHDEETAPLPVPVAAGLGETSFLARALALVDAEPELEAAARQLVAVTNRVLVADEVDLGDPEAVEAATGRVRDLLSLALEHLGDGEPARARPWLGSLPFADLFRVGFSLTLELKRAADRLWREAITRAPMRPELLEPDDRAFVEGLRRHRPVLAEEHGHRDFTTLADVEAARARLERVETAIWLLLDTLGLDPLAVPREHGFATLLRTACVHHVLGEGFRFDPLTAEDVQRFLQVGMAGKSGARALKPAVREELALFLEGKAAARGAAGRAHVRALAESWLGALDQELARLPPRAKLDPRFVGGLWVLS